MSKSILEMHDIVFQPQAHKGAILKDLQIQLDAKKFYMLVGANGSGKSTILKMIQKHQAPTSGEIRFEKENIKNIKATTLAKDILYIAQRPEQQLCQAMTIAEQIKLYFHAFKLSQMNHDCLMERLRSFHPYFVSAYHQAIAPLSGGQKQLLVMALGFLRKVKLLLLDEHTAALDPKAAEKIMEKTLEIIQKNQHCTLMVSHQEVHQRYVDSVLVLEDGKITPSG